MEIHIRSEIASLPAMKAMPTLPNTVTLSLNENPEPPRTTVAHAGIAGLEEANRYPDPSCARLRAALADGLGVSTGNICVGAGSSGVLLSVLSLVCTGDSEVVYPWRSFEFYPFAIPIVGACPVPVPLTDEGGHDLPAMLDAITDRTAAVIMCSPNNPTGLALTATQIRIFVEHVPADVLVIVDEAYIELATDDDVSTSIPLIEEHPNIIVLRTFSKAYALAGLRVGYGLGSSGLIGALAAVTPPFVVTTPPQEVALAALGDVEGLARARARNASERGRVIPSLRSLGYSVPDSQGNFVWIPASESGPGFASACEDAGAIVKCFPEGVRITLGLPADNDRVLRVARQFRSAGSVV